MQFIITPVRHFGHFCCINHIAAHLCAVLRVWAQIFARWDLNRNFSLFTYLGKSKKKLKLGWWKYFVKSESWFHLEHHLIMIRCLFLKSWENVHIKVYLLTGTKKKEKLHISNSWRTKGDYTFSFSKHCSCSKQLFFQLLCFYWLTFESTHASKYILK